MEAHADDNWLFGIAAMAIGALFIVFGSITAFDIRYLFTGTVPFIVVGVSLVVFGRYLFHKEVIDSTGHVVAYKRHKTFTGKNRKDRRRRWA